MLDKRSFLLYFCNRNVKKSKFMRTKNVLFLVACLILSLNVKAQDDYLRVTELSQIQNGSSVILAARHDSLSMTSYYAMKNDAAGKPQGVSFIATNSGDGMILPADITDNESEYCWTVGMSGDDFTFINADGNMLGYGSSGTDFVKNGVNSTWSIAAAVSGGGTSVPNHNAFVITNSTVTNRSIAFRKYSNDAVYEKFAPYSNSATNLNGDNYFFYIDIFVKSSEAKPVVSLPKFNPEAGDYTTTQNVTISCDTEDATIYYTLDGKNPTDTCAVYTHPIEIAKTTTIKAFAKKEGMTNSGIATAKYNIIEPVTLSFYCNGELTDTISVAKGKEIGELPEAAVPEGFSFVGWSSSEISTYVNVMPEIITSTTTANEDMNLYAVFSVSNNNSTEADITSITKSDAVVIAISKDEKYYAMSQIKGSSGQPTAKEIEVLNGKILTPLTDDVKWNISYDKGNMVICPNGDEESWLYCTSGSNNNAVRIGTNADNNIFEMKTVEIEGEVYPDYLYNKTTERFVGAYYDKDVAIDWRAYKLTNSGDFPSNIKNQTYHFYKSEGKSYYCTNVEIPQAQTIATNTTWTNVSVKNKIIIEKGVTLTISGAMACKDADNLVIKDGGQLLHSNSGVKATIEKEIQGYGNTNGHWYAISAPLVGSVSLSNIDGLMPTSNNYDLYRYDEPTNVWENVKDASNDFTTFDVGRAYLYANEYDATVSFVGEINGESERCYLSRTDDVRLPGFHLIGNPFTHNIYKGAGAAIDNNNLVTGYYTLSNSGGWEANMSDDNPIAPCQGILVKTMTAGEIVINKTNKASSRRSDDMSILSFKVANKEYEDKTYVVFEDDYGLEKINHQNEDIPMIYVTVEDSDYAIAMMNNDIKEIPLSFKAKTMGEYTISMNAENNKFYHIYLFDKMTGETINMLSDDYTFAATSNDNPERFIVKLYDVSSVNEIDVENSYVYVNNGNLIITNVTGKSLVEIYDVMGRKIICETINNESSINIENIRSGVYVVRTSDNMGIKTQKIVVE